MNIETFGKLKSHGWDNGQPCVADIYATGNMPTFKVTQKHGLNVTLGLAFDIKCKKHADSTEFDQVFTLVTKEIDFVGSVSIFLILIKLNLD